MSTALIGSGRKHCLGTGRVGPGVWSAMVAYMVKTKNSLSDVH